MWQVTCIERICSRSYRIISYRATDVISFAMEPKWKQSQRADWLIFNFRIYLIRFSFNRIDKPDTLVIQMVYAHDRPNQFAGGAAFNICSGRAINKIWIEKDEMEMCIVWIFYVLIYSSNILCIVGIYTFCYFRYSIGSSARHIMIAQSISRMEVKKKLIAHTQTNTCV